MPNPDGTPTPYEKGLAEWQAANPQGDGNPNDSGAAGYWGNAGPALSGAKNWLFGGNATEGMASAPQNYGYASGYIKNQLGGAGNRPAPTFNSYDAAQARAQQATLANQLRQIASGQQAGAGELAVNRQIGQAQASQQGMAQMARGQNAGLAQRGAARNMASMGVTGAGMAQGAQMQDQSNAQGQLAGILNGMRGQDIAIGQGNQNAELSQTQMNQNAQLGYLAQLLGWDQAALQQDLAKRGLDMNDKGMFPQLLAAGGQIAAAGAGGA